MKVSRQFKENFTAIGFFVLSLVVLLLCVVWVLKASPIAALIFGVLLVIGLSFGAYELAARLLKSRAERERNNTTQPHHRP
jgi:uncharacterized membrane protein YqjE